MKNVLRRFASLGLLLLAAACSSPDSRIGGNHALFDSWSPAVQEKIRAGRIDVGFTSDMVRVALGDADRKATRTTARGTEEVWVYFDHGPKFSIGVGMGASHGSTAYGGAMVVGDNGFADNEVMRVILAGDRVVAIETRR
ncbi:MAG: hypothetical protein JWM88_1957 [Verrucomicrobia bacterium]|nr:hypothetical protein [Verrucomicrobiota bacterium]